MGRPPKRKASENVSSTAPTNKNEGAPNPAKKKQKTEPTASSTRPKRTSARSTKSPPLAKETSNGKTAAAYTAKSSLKSSSPKRGSERSGKHRSKVSKDSNLQNEEDMIDYDDDQQAHVSVAVPSDKKKAKTKVKTKNEATEESADEIDADGHQYWLMKAEPDSRIEKGKDVKFSIDDLKAAMNPEPWDGVRNLEESAFDPEHPYYDEKSSRESPKWHLVHVTFRQKFPEIIKLKALQKFSKEGGELEYMQTLRRTRLSVSKVSKKEWNFIMSLVDEEDEIDAAAQPHPQPQLVPDGFDTRLEAGTKKNQKAEVNGYVEENGA